MKKVLLLIVTIILIGIAIKSIFIAELNQSGVYYKFSIEEKTSFREELNSFAITIKSQLDREEIVYDGMQIKEERFIFEPLDEDDTFKVVRILNNYASIFKIEENEGIYSLSFTSEYLKKQKSELLEKTKKILENRLEKMGLYNTLFDAFLSEKTTVISSDKEFIEITILKLCDKCPEQKVRQILGSMGYFSVMPLNENDEFTKNAVPIIDSSMLKKVSLVFEDDKPKLLIQINKNATKVLLEYTATHILKSIFIIIDGKVYAKPRIVDIISNGYFTVDLDALTAQEIHDLALIVDNGALPCGLLVEKMGKIID